MAEAEDVITDLARHATVFAQDLWRRHRTAPGGSAGPQLPRLESFARRLDLLVAAIFRTSYPIRIAQPPAPPTVLARIFRSSEAPRLQQAVPATDGASIWLPPTGGADHATALARYRVAALQQAMRAQRGSALHWAEAASPLLRDLYLLVEAHAADQALIEELPGMATPIARLRGAALAARPSVASLAPARRPVEKLLRLILQPGCDRVPDCPPCGSPAQSLDAARMLLERITGEQRQGGAGPASRSPGDRPLLRDWWTGDLRPPPVDAAASMASAGPPSDSPDPAVKPRSVRLARRPEVRRPEPDEDDDRPGAFMIQTAQPHEHAEDPAGLQRPSDRDDETSAEDYAESVADLQQARLVVTAGKPREILMSDDGPGAQARAAAAPQGGPGSSLSYPEWDYRIGRYREPGATVCLLQSTLGPQQWVDETLARHRLLLDTIRHRFEMLRAVPQRLRKQVEGEEIDLESYVESHADFHAGLASTQALYQTRRRARRSMAITLLVDTSGSTDGWIAAGRRVIDVEREALLLVCIALERMGEPYSVQAFSGEGPRAVSVTPIKRFDEAYGETVARRIAALEPEQYTRVGTAVRHATALLMQEPATHRLLLLLSDGRPNDVDLYEGRYGLEDTRQAVCEARLQGIFPFCLTVDRQGAGYLPAVFGAGQYGLLPRPELLPIVLLDWMKRLVSS